MSTEVADRVRCPLGPPTPGGPPVYVKLSISLGDLDTPVTKELILEDVARSVLSRLAREWSGCGAKVVVYEGVVESIPVELECELQLSGGQDEVKFVDELRSLLAPPDFAVYATHKRVGV